MKTGRYGDYIVRDRGKSLQIDNVKHLSESYHIDKKSGHVFQYRKLTHRNEMGYQYVPLNAHDLEKKLINSRKLYRENNSLGKKIKRFFGFI